jgi:hypothetical protein
MGVAWRSGQEDREVLRRFLVLDFFGTAADSSILSSASSSINLAAIVRRMARRFIAL